MAQGCVRYGFFPCFFPWFTLRLSPILGWSPGITLRRTSWGRTCMVGFCSWMTLDLLCMTGMTWVNCSWHDWNVCWNNLPSLFRVVFSDYFLPFAPMFWLISAAVQPSGSQGVPVHGHIDLHGETQVISWARRPLSCRQHLGYPNFQWKIMEKSTGNQETYGIFHHSWAGLLQIVHHPGLGELKWLEWRNTGNYIKLHIWVFVENGLRQNHSFPLSL